MTRPPRWAWLFVLAASCSAPCSAAHLEQLSASPPEVQPVAELRSPSGTLVEIITIVTGESYVQHAGWTCDGEISGPRHIRETSFSRFRVEASARVAGQVVPIEGDSSRWGRRLFSHSSGSTLAQARTAAAAVAFDTCFAADGSRLALQVRSPGLGDDVWRLLALSPTPHWLADVRPNVSCAQAVESTRALPAL